MLREKQQLLFIHNERNTIRHLGNERARKRKNIRIIIVYSNFSRITRNSSKLMPDKDRVEFFVWHKKRLAVKEILEQNVSTVMGLVTRIHPNKKKHKHAWTFFFLFNNKEFCCQTMTRKNFVTNFPSLQIVVRS